MTPKIKLSDYVLNTLRFGEGEILARFHNEFTDEEQTNLIKAAKANDPRVADLDGDTQWLVVLLTRES